MAHAASADSGMILFQEPQTEGLTAAGDSLRTVSSITLALCEWIFPEHIARHLQFSGLMSSQFVDKAYGLKGKKETRS